MGQLLKSPDDFCFVLRLRNDSGTSKVARLLQVPDFRSSTIYETLFQPADTSNWYGLVASGSSEDEYESALRTVLNLLTSHRRMLARFTAAGGQIEFTAHQIAAIETATDFKSAPSDQAKYKMFELSLYPAFLQILVKLKIELRVCVWA